MVYEGLLQGQAREADIEALKKQFPEKRPARNDPLKTSPKTGRNDPCPCGSGEKFKKCCMKP